MAVTQITADLETWERFHEQRFAPEQIASDPVLSRWARSVDAPATPTNPILEGDVQDQHIAVVTAPDSPFHGFTEALRATSLGGFLSDAGGHIARSDIAPELTELFRKTQLGDKTCWSEDSRGTNAIGTTLAESKAVAVVGAAHFELINHCLCCYAAPLRDVRGTIIGVVDASGPAELAHPALHSIVLATATALNDRLALEAYEAAVAGGWLALEARVRATTRAAFVGERSGRIRVANRGFSLAYSPRDQTRYARLVAERLAGGGPLPDKITLDTTTLALEPIGETTAPFAALVELEHRPRRTVSPPPRPRHSAFSAIAGHDPQLVAAIDRAARLAASTLPVLLLAETGTGKELFARAIHRASPRANRPFMAINCGALSGSLLESELFGYAPGAFTGARAGGSEGRLAAADRGTLFLDELAEMSPSVQAMLLRFLEDGSYFRVGDSCEGRADVRIVAATSRDLPGLVQEGSFRSDLYYRIRGATLRLPALRARTDKLALTRALLEQIAERNGSKCIWRLSENAAQWLDTQPWPGNVRELATALEHAVVMAGERETLEIGDFPVPEPVAGESEGLRNEAERTALIRALTETDGNLSATARRLGVSRGTVYRMLERHGIDPRG